jgi:outer membrane protein
MFHALILLSLAQTPVAGAFTLEDVFALANTNHVDVQLADLARDQASQDERAAYATILPRVDLGASVSRTYSASNQQIIVNNSVLAGTHGFLPTAFGVQVRASQNLLDGGKWWTQIARGHTDREASEAQLAEARLQAHLSVAHLFFELVRAQRSLQILTINVDRSQEQVERSEALFQAGRGAKSDAFAARVNLLNDRISVAQQRARVDLSRNALNVALGRQAQEPLQPQPPELGQVPGAMAAADVDAQALRARPGLLALRKQVQSAEQAVAIARGDYYPSLNASVIYQRGQGEFGTVVSSPFDNFNATGSLNLSWNLFAGRTTSINVQKAELAGSQARVQLLRSERAVTEEAERGVRTLAVGLEALELSTLARSTAQEGLSLAQERFKAGAGATLEIRDAQLKLTSAELALLSNQVDLQLAHVDIQAALGQL